MVPQRDTCMAEGQRGMIKSRHSQEVRVSSVFSTQSRRSDCINSRSYAGAPHAENAADGRLVQRARPPAGAGLAAAAMLLDERDDVAAAQSVVVRFAHDAEHVRPRTKFNQPSTVLLYLLPCPPACGGWVGEPA